MNDTTLSPSTRKRRSVCVGSPVEFQDGNEWVISALPVGAAADPIVILQSRLGTLEAKLQLLERLQAHRLEEAKNAVTDDGAVESALADYDLLQTRIVDGESEFRRLQIEIVHFALSLNYDVTVDEVESITTLKQVRKVSEALQGTPQLKEIREVIDALKGEDSGN